MLVSADATLCSSRPWTVPNLRGRKPRDRPKAGPSNDWLVILQLNTIGPTSHSELTSHYNPCGHVLFVEPQRSTDQFEHMKQWMMCRFQSKLQEGWSQSFNREKYKSGLSQLRLVISSCCWCAQINLVLCRVPVHTRRSCGSGTSPAFWRWHYCFF